MHTQKNTSSINWISRFKEDRKLGLSAGGWYNCKVLEGSDEGEYDQNTLYVF